MFDVFYIGVKPNLFVHEQECNSIDHARQLSRTRYCWIVNYLSDYTGWDWLWEPRPWEAGQRHAWPSQWQRDSGTYLVPQHGYTDTNYHTDQVITRLPSMADHWTVPSNIDYTKFDFSWHPDYTDPEQYEYHFGTQWQSAGGPVYNHGAGPIKLVTDQRAQAIASSMNWHCPDSVDPDTFDFSWHPSPLEPAYTYQFGTQWQKTNGPCYTTPGATDIKFLPSPRSVKITKDDCWTVPDNADVESFDWTWHPDATEPLYIYQFGTQHQRTGGPLYTVTGATDIKFVDQIRIKTQRTAGKVYVIDHLDGNASKVREQISHCDCSVVRYFDNYLDTLTRIAKNADNEHCEFVWVVSSICDYTDFDFSWHPEQWQASMLHVFASNDQKFGDTFFMHVPTFAYRAGQAKLLEWYDVNFVNTSVPRRPIPVIQHNEDSQVDAVKKFEWAGPLALFTRTDYVDRTLVTVPLWRELTKTIVPLDPGASSVIVPRVAIPYIKTQLYDYPYINREHIMLKGTPLDIVFLSNGESDADYLYAHLLDCASNTNQVHCVTGIKGRVASQHAAANASTTDWYFVVPGKLHIERNFDWSWQPDRMQQAKHYIFHAHNPVNGLIYGHMAMVAYNKKLVLETQGTGLDFTMEKAHEVVPIVSGTATYASTPMMAWRTAFREVLKLQASLPDIENEYRLNQWLTVDLSADQWSMKGAQDAVAFYNEVKGDPTELHKSYEWDWLASYVFIKRGLVE